MSIYGKPVWQLLIDFSNETLDSHDSVFTPQDAIKWFQRDYSEVKKGTINAHIRMMSTNVQSRLHWNPQEYHHLFFSLGRGRYRRYHPDQDPFPIMSENNISYDGIETTTGQVASDDLGHQEYIGGAEFAYEKDLQNYLVKNLEAVEPGLELYDQDGITGVEFPAGDRRRIDILAVDKENNLVVLELKVSKGHDRAIGQILRYIGWIKENLAEVDQDVRGIIIAKDITSDLKWASSTTSLISLREYSLTFSLDEVK